MKSVVNIDIYEWRWWSDTLWVTITGAWLSLNIIAFYKDKYFIFPFSCVFGLWIPAGAPPVEEPKVNFFTGTGRRLDGKPARHSNSSGSNVTSSTSTPAASSSTAPRGSASTPVPPTTSQRPAGKLVFGSSSGSGASSTPKVGSAEGITRSQRANYYK